MKRRSIIPLLLLAACAPQIGRTGAGGGGPRTAPDESCTLPSGEATRRPSTITIGLTEPVDPHNAPVARNDAERIVFRHLYDTPLRVDCEGRATVELAEKWVRDDNGRRWTFRVRDDAKFWDGAPVLAQDVVFGKGGAGYTLSALEARVVSMTLTKSREDVPSILADPGLAVAKPAPDSGWPIGTGRYWSTGATSTAKEIRAFGSSGDTLLFKLAAGGGGGGGGGADARDLIDAGVDLLITRDRVLRDYAATLPNYTVTALPWDRTYLFVTPEAGGTRFDGLEQAVRAEARRAEGGFWWLDLKACGPPATTSPPIGSASQRRILYPRSDPTARELAGRLAALTRGVAVARGSSEFADALSRGRDFGYIVALPRVALDLCRVSKDLLPTWAATMTALVDTRATAVVRRGVARWGVDQDGTVHLAPPP